MKKVWGGRRLRVSFELGRWWIVLLELLFMGLPVHSADITLSCACGPGQL
jgi:hypothetical protein